MTRAAAIVLTLCLGGTAAAADEKVPPPPSPAAIKACVAQMDVGNKWRFEWKALEIGPPRHPRNNLEALAFLGGEGRRGDYGYPVHVVYDLVGLATIDSMYWLIRDANGHWQIPAVCVLK